MSLHGSPAANDGARLVMVVRSWVEGDDVCCTANRFVLAAAAAGRVVLVLSY